MQMKKIGLPGLKLFSTQRVCDVFNGVTQTVGVVISRVDAPAEKSGTQINLNMHFYE